jgi:KaiC/GvpD/RAD55 family RecA-like ATPase
MARESEVADRLRSFTSGGTVALKLGAREYADNYLAALGLTVRDLGGESNSHTIYVSVTNPASLVWSLLQALDIQSGRLTFVDAISHLMMSYENVLPNASYVESPTMLEGIMLRIEYLLRRHPGQRNMVIIDSVNSLAVHNSPDVLSEFFHILVNNLKTRSVLTVLFTTSDGEGSELDRILSLVVDESFGLGGTE